MKHSCKCKAAFEHLGHDVPHPSFFSFLLSYINLYINCRCALFWHSNSLCSRPRKFIVGMHGREVAKSSSPLFFFFPFSFLFLFLSFLLQAKYGRKGEGKERMKERERPCFVPCIQLSGRGSCVCVCTRKYATQQATCPCTGGRGKRASACVRACALPKVSGTRGPSR